MFTTPTESYWGIERGIEKALTVQVHNRAVFADMGSVVIRRQFTANKYTTHCY